MITKNSGDTYLVPLTELLEAGCHFGHQAARWHPKMAQYIWQAKDGIHIFDLAKTATKLNEACLAVLDFVKQGKTIVFVGTKRQAQEIIKEEAQKANVPYVTTRWLGGVITNWDQVKKSIDKLKDMKEKKEKGEYDKYTKKENLQLEKEINRLTKSLSGLVNLEKVPDAIFVVDCKREVAAVKEARMKNIKIFAIVDSNCDPDLIDYVIPANDDAVRSIKLIVGTFSKAVLKGVQLKNKINGQNTVKGTKKTKR